ncbi:hypothetical protein ACH5RR_040844 [Cinchona calisaya]|uniref:Uncharacterized protein n=1 Tax=Cinchona calisaya TaxID=153742 RepID=A0ABD2XUX3_9GENT
MVAKTFIGEVVAKNLHSQPPIIATICSSALMQPKGDQSGANTAKHATSSALAKRHALDATAAQEIFVDVAAVSGHVIGAVSTQNVSVDATTSREHAEGVATIQELADDPATFPQVLNYCFIAPQCSCQYCYHHHISFLYEHWQKKQ